MLLTGTIEVELRINDLIKGYERDTGVILFPSDFEKFYHYWLEVFKIYSADMKTICWEQNKQLIKQEYESFTG